MKRDTREGKKDSCTAYIDKMIAFIKQGREYWFSAFLVLTYLT